MRITALCENISERADVLPEHGLSLFIETRKHRMLFDMGASDVFLKNAAALGIPVESADIAVLSHGHTDHGGGLAAFLAANSAAPVYLNENAFGDHCNPDGAPLWLDKDLKGNGRLVFTGDGYAIDAGLILFTGNGRPRPYEMGTYGISILKEGVPTPDREFLHEQYLLIEEAGISVLITGCSHKGILNILSFAPKAPDVVIGGFHYMKVEDRAFLAKKAEGMLASGALFYTCHCTGRAQYAYLKDIMGDRLNYLSAGQSIEL